MTAPTTATLPPQHQPDDGAALAPRALQDEFGRQWRHDDPLDAMCRYAITPMGKLFRPQLLLEACAAVGGDVRQAVPAAVGAEYGHVASLVHDDIIDGDAVRRGRPAVHVAFGRDHAIVVGDALIFRLFLALSDCAERGTDAERVVASLRAVASAGVELCRGQTLESELCGRLDAGLEDYCLMVRGKTGALFRGSCEVGAILGGGDARQVSALGRYGDQLGLAFQMVDDVLAYSSDSAVAGKDLLSDLRNRRMTFPLVVAGRLAPTDARRTLGRVFATAERAEPAPEVDQALHAEVVALLRRTGALPAARGLVVDHSTQALAALGELPRSAARERLADLVHQAVERAA